MGILLLKNLPEKLTVLKEDVDRELIVNVLSTLKLDFDSFFKSSINKIAVI